MPGAACGSLEFSQLAQLVSSVACFVDRRARGPPGSVGNKDLVQRPGQLLPLLQLPPEPRLRFGLCHFFCSPNFSFNSNTCSPVSFLGSRPAARSVAWSKTTGGVS